MKKSIKIQLGIRLFTAGLILYFSNTVPGFLFAAICMVFPSLNFDPRVFMRRLAIGAADDDQKALLDTITTQVNKILSESQKDSVKKADVDKLIKETNDQIAKLTNDQMKVLKDRVDEMAKANEQLVADLAKSTEALNKQGLEIKRLGDKAPEEKKTLIKNFRQAVKEGLIKANEEAAMGMKPFEEIKDSLYGDRISLSKFFEKNPQGKLSFKIDYLVEGVNKAAVDMLESNIVQSNVSALRLTELDPSRVGIPLTIYPHVMDVFPTKRLTRPNMALLVVYSYEDGADTKTEGAASAKSSFLFKTVSFPSFFIATYFTLSDETLDDLDEALDEISMTAPDKILDKIDNKILGTAGDDAADLKGIRTTGATGKSTAFDSSAFTTSIVNANIVDAIACAKRQCETNKYKPNVVYLNPTEVMKLAAAKNSFEDSRLDRRVVFDAIGNPTMIYGLRILQSTEIPTNQFIVMDNRQPMIGRRRDMTMEIGYNGTDLVEGQKTVVLKVRLAFGVRDKAAIIWCSSITTAISDINATS